MKKGLLSILITLSLGACASIPDMNYEYYRSKGVANVEIVRTFDCSVSQDRLVIVTTPPEVKTSYSADYKSNPVTLEIGSASDELVDRDLTITFYDDGRLKGINSISTGQGEAISKAVIGVVSSAIGMVGGSGSEGTPLPACAALANWGKGKPVSIKFGEEFALDGKATGPFILEPARESAALFGQLGVSPPQARIEVLPTPLNPAQLASEDESNEYMTLKLQKVYPATLAVSIDGTDIWRGGTMVPTNEDYELPFPKNAPFGKTTFVVAVAESGAVTSIQYAESSGVSGALGSVDALATALQPTTKEAAAAEVKAEADLIAQSQRLARCRAQPENCE